jgi:hypothetical protein
MKKELHMETFLEMTRFIVNKTNEFNEKYTAEMFIVAGKLPLPPCPGHRKKEFSRRDHKRTLPSCSRATMSLKKTLPPSHRLIKICPAVVDIFNIQFDRAMNIPFI